MSNTYKETKIIGVLSTGGITPIGTLNITENGEYNVTNYAKVDVDVETGGVSITDATATADKIFENEIAYNNEGRVVGTFTIKEELTDQEEIVDQIRLALIGKIVGGTVAKEEWTFTLTDGTTVNKTIIKEG